MRVKAPIDVSGTRGLRLRTAVSGDPIKTQYRMASTSKTAESVGEFRAFDPEHGSWPLSTQQHRILSEVVSRMPAGWIADVLLPMANASESRSEPSLRLIDWFVTNYSKSHGVYIDGTDVHVDYVDVRRAYQCRNFDPFRRNLKLTFTAPADDGALRDHHTTVGQLNFLMWAHNTGVLKYVREHRLAIDEDMCHACKRVRRLKCEQSGAQTKRRRTALSKSRNVKCRISKKAPADSAILYATKTVKM